MSEARRLTHDEIIQFLIKERDFHHTQAYAKDIAPAVQNASLLCFAEIEYLLRCIREMESNICSDVFVRLLRCIREMEMPKGEGEE